MRTVYFLLSLFLLSCSGAQLPSAKTAAGVASALIGVIEGIDRANDLMEDAQAVQDAFQKRDLALLAESVAEAAGSTCATLEALCGSLPKDNAECAEVYERKRQARAVAEAARSLVGE